MKKQASTLAVALGLAVSGLAYAGPEPSQSKATGPVQMTDAQMDNVVAGALVNLLVIDAVDVNNNNVQVAVPVNAAVAVGILGAGAAGATQLGNITQRP